MEDFFIPYKLSLKIKQMGFDEECFGFYNKDDNNKAVVRISDASNSAPTFCQVFRWFRRRFNLHQSIIKHSGFKTYWCQIEMISDKKSKIGEYDVIYATNISGFTDYNDAEIACLKKMIEIIEQVNT